MLKFEKFHFMVEQGIILGHVVSCKGTKVNKAKVDLVVNLPYPTSVWEVCFFLGHASFYHRFIKDFSQIILSLSRLLQKEVPFEFGQEYKKPFDKLKFVLTIAPIIQPSN